MNPNIDATNVYINWAGAHGVRNAGNDSAGGANGKSWLVAIAMALGEILGQKAEKLVSLTDQLGGLTGKQDAQEFQKVMAEFQAQSQLFSMISNATSTAIKSIGEGMTAVARKQ